LIPRMMGRTNAKSGLGNKGGALPIPSEEVIADFHDRSTTIGHLSGSFGSYNSPTPSRAEQLASWAKRKEEVWAIRVAVSPPILLQDA
jgi:hypothetical protein